ncbi:MAG TPA: DASH family cryptochrome [Luteibaculaceae bacterium]|nr:DASH family cryptochrome [Luteibaculaceae bacterium]
MTSLVWIQNEQRLSDNPLFWKVRNDSCILPVYVIDPRKWENNRLGLSRMSALKTRFLADSLQNLKLKLSQLGSDLHIVEGFPEEVLPALAETHQLRRMVYTAGHCSEERSVQNKVIQNLNHIGIEAVAEGEHTLIADRSLPFPIKALPDIFTKFRHSVERETTPPAELPVPTSFPNLPKGYAPQSWPGFEASKIQLEEHQQVLFKGGEDRAMERLRYYTTESRLLSTYKETRNGLLGSDFSSHLSPWMAHGNVSARTIYWQIKAYEAQYGANDSTYWLIFELLWRDFFHFTARKHGDDIFKPEGFNQTYRKLGRKPQRDFWQWTRGETVDPFVNANMIELACTGFMSNRGRQNVASYLIHDLGIDWTAGAAYFESQLIDYDVHSNWCNWAYLAGVGNDPRGLRKFDTRRQAQQYDASGEYTRYWTQHRIGA